MVARWLLAFQIGGLLYIPFCLIELIISPQLHRIVYGFYVRTDFSQTL